MHSHDPFSNIFEGPANYALSPSLKKECVQRTVGMAFESTWSSVLAGIDRLHASCGFRCQHYIAPNSHELHKPHF